ncbi:hypothetical protein VaNZ11_008906, partial [Volvox africanus]
MGKKKGKSGSKTSAAAESSSPTAPPQEAESPPALVAEASDAPSLEASTQEPATSSDTQRDILNGSPVNASSSSSEINELRLELDACKQQISELQAKNASLSEENERLKSAQSTFAVSQAPVATPVPDFEALTQRISALKAEQAVADAAREAAWTQLKSVVADIARLAAPDGVT